MAGHLEKKRDEVGYWKFRLKRIVDEEKEQYEQRYEGSIKGRENARTSKTSWPWIMEVAVPMRPSPRTS
jgi:ribosomal protein L19E